ncbi:50S ribosomal protein L7ae-like protein [Pueribacillus theae]|uniref:RNA-binding protein DCC39_03575 n=1 Tax=Pueribacillus theae TaxID=2171751 RepID=A0A2U1K5Y8_9BACI|nr:50S ribosomal protein L7ae-like protein [Pueribacillus theae]PWA12961.1 50S ribosomal protein L7ae-like protein [Pueribacillus theae]
MSYEKVTQAKSIIVGTKQAMKALQDNEVSELIIADDAEVRVVGKLKSLAAEMQVPITIVDSMKKLGKACKIEVGAAAVAIKK